jgi:hypothetical protein
MRSKSAIAGQRAGVVSIVQALALLWFASIARAEVLQAPISGKPIPLGDARVLCAAPSGGWSSDPSSRTLRPPRSEDAVGQAIEVKSR